MARLFVGIDLPRSYQDRVRSFTQRLDKGITVRVNWTRSGNWHLTLKFLGEIESSRIPAVIDALDTVDFPAFSMQAGKAAAFPHAKHPQVIWLGLDQGAQECETLATAVNDALVGIDIDREKKRFRPHLTLGRIKNPGNENWQSILNAAAKGTWPAFTVKKFTLWQSELSPTGALHTVIKKFPLKN